MTASRSTPLDVVLAVARATLGVAAISETDNFFACGGDSFSALEFCARAEEILDVQVPLELLWETETLAELASALQKLRVAEA